MPKRDYVREIQEIKNRYLKRGHRWGQLNRRFDPLLGVLICLSKVDEKDAEREIIRYVFIGLIACLEGYLRLVIKDLVDNSQDCRQNIGELSEIKFDVKSVLAIHGKKVSVGEFVSHLVPLSSFDLINKNMSIITGVDFTSEIKNMDMENKKGEIKKMFPDTPAWVKKTFESRNIYCHELAPKKETIKSFYRRAALCTIAIHEYTAATEVFIRQYLNE
jgi:hypothetical protein